jgi:predicted metal-dependent hydrolase
MIHKQKPFRVRETYMANPAFTKCVQALQAVVDSYGSSDSLLAAQCRDALKASMNISKDSNK